MFAAAAARLPDQHGTCRAWFVPGRIELFGKHTDYGGGKSCLCATPWGLAVVLQHLESAAGAEITVHTTDPDAESHSECLFAAGALRPRPAPGHWAAYAYAVVERLVDNFGARPPAGALHVAIAADLPPASGMSTSSALVCGVYLALSSSLSLARTLPSSADAVCEMLGTFENGQTFTFATAAGEVQRCEGRAGVGTFGGSEDHTAIMRCRKGRLSLFRFCPTQHIADVAFPEGLRLVVLATGVRAEKTKGALGQYNDQVDVVRSAERKLAAAGYAGRTLFELAPPVPDARLDELLSAREARRVRQFLRECTIVDEVAASGVHFARFAELVRESHRLAAAALGHNAAQTDAAVRLAEERGAAAAAFGAGFGGSVYAVVDAARAEAFAAEWKAAYDAWAQGAQQGARVGVWAPAAAAHEVCRSSG